jgi:hypothetical protein
MTKIFPVCDIIENTGNEVLVLSETCPICLDAINIILSKNNINDTFCNDSSNIYGFETLCRHKFHIKCLSRWTNSKQNCPTCRLNLCEDDLNGLQILKHKIYPDNSHHIVNVNQIHSVIKPVI